MGIETANIKVQPVLTKEQVEYEKALKNLRYMTAKLKISQEGVNIENVPDDELEIVTKLFDEMDMIQRDFNIEAQKIQMEVNNKMRELQEGANKKLADAQARYRGLINSMKDETIGDKIEDYTKDYSMSKEREDEIKKSLAEELAKSQSEKKK